MARRPPEDPHRAELTIDWCARHTAARATQRRVGWLLIGLAAALLKVAAMLGAARFMLLAGVALLTCASRIVCVRSIDHHTARISNGSPHLRAGVPDVAGLAG